MNLSVNQRWFEPFNPEFLERPSTPTEVAGFSLGGAKIPRWNHCLVKEMGDIEPLGIPVILAASYHRCASWLLEHDIAVRDRWAYLTADTQPVPPGTTQRMSGWHIDGMQGDEVPIKQLPDLTFIWSDVLPTKFFLHPIGMTGFNGSRHDIHRWIQRAIVGREEQAIVSPSSIIWLIDPYVPHAGSANQNIFDLPRNFLRLSFSKTPVTSHKMTLNPDAHYGYSVHSTSGEIPSHLQ